MFHNRSFGVALVVLGVIANNYVYLHDLIFGKYEAYQPGTIVLGWLAALLILATLAVAGIGLAIVLRSHP
jgi:hypothetical protein